MIDPTQLPLLIKAVDFVFEEGHKILEERRERRKKTNDVASDSEDPEPASELVLPKPEDEKEIRQDLLTTKIDDLLWQNNQLEIQHLVKLLETYSHNFYLAKEQYAKWGDALVPPIIVHNMQDSENSMLETIKRLEIVLSKVYKKDINIIE